MKIVMLNDDFPPLARGGAGTVTFNLAVDLKNAGHDVSVITSVRDAAMSGIGDIEGVKVFRLRSVYPKRWQSWLSLRNPQTVGRVERILADLEPDVVHVHNIHQYLSYHCLKLAKRSGAKVFLTAHDVMLFHYGKLSSFIDPAKPACDPHPNYRVAAWRQLREYGTYYNPFRNMAIRRSLKYVDGIFAVSEALKEALEQNGIRGAKVVHNGIDVSRWRRNDQEAAAFIAARGLGGKKIVLCSGRITGLKGRDLLAEAMGIVRKKIPQAVLILGGAKEFSRTPEESAERDGIVLTEWMPQEVMRSALHACSVVVVPSIYLDPFPTATLEAMACGEPVVATCFGGTKEAVDDGKTGWIVNPFDVESMASRIIQLLDDPGEAARMGAAGFEKVKNEFSLEQQVAAMLRRYQG